MSFKQKHQNISVSPLRSLDDGTKREESNVLEQVPLKEVSVDTILALLKTEMLTYFPLIERKKLQQYCQTKNVTAIVELVQRSKKTILKDKLHIFSPFIHPTLLLKTLLAVLTLNEKVYSPFLRTQVEEVSKKLLLPNKIDCVDFELNSNIGSSNYMESNSLFSKQTLYRQTKNSPKITSFKYLPVEQMVKEAIQEKKKKTAQRKKIKRVVRVMNKKTCEYIIKTTKKIDGKWAGKKCGIVLLENESCCPKHIGKKDNNLVLYPYTCKFVVSQAQGKNRERSRKGLECGEICLKGDKYCKVHLKSTNHVVEEDDCEEVTSIDMDDNASTYLEMPKKENASTVIRSIKVRANLSVKQKNLYSKMSGDCRFVWNTLSKKQDEFDENNPPDKNILRQGIINNLSDEFSFLSKTPKDCRDRTLLDFCTSWETMNKQYDVKVSNQEKYIEHCNILGKTPQVKEIKKPVINLRTKKQDQVLHIPKSAVTLGEKRIMIYPRYFKTEICLGSRTKRDKKYKNIFKNGIKHGISIIRTRSGRYYFSIPYDVPIKKTVKSKDVCSGDPGVKTFLTTFDTDGECNSYGDKCDIKLRKIHKKIDFIGKLIFQYRAVGDIKKVKYLQRMIVNINEHIRNKVRNMHYHVINELLEYNRIYMPKFNSKQMCQQKSTFKSTKRQMNSLSHYQFSQRLKSKAEEICMEVLISDEWRTTKACTRCLRTNHVGMSREYKCFHCGYEWSRDAQSARNNLLKYLALA